MRSKRPFSASNEIISTTPSPRVNQEANETSTPSNQVIILCTNRNSSIASCCSSSSNVAQMLNRTHCDRVCVCLQLRGHQKMKPVRIHRWLETCKCKWPLTTRSFSGCKIISDDRMIFPYFTNDMARTRPNQENLPVQLPQLQKLTHTFNSQRLSLV